MSDVYRSRAEEVTFGSWLKERRRALDITQDQLAERADVSRITLRKLESGERRPSGQVAGLLADLLGVPADERDDFVAFARTGQVADRGELTSAISPRYAPWRKVQPHSTNLPMLLTPIFGREADEARVREYLRDPKIRLLTLTGAPGIGKTSLALQVASGLVDQFPDGVFLVELAPVIDPAMVLGAIARVLGLKEMDRHSIEDALFNHARHKRMLLVLDNFEQVLDAAGEVVRLLGQSHWLKVLLTSREALHVKSERRYPVPPLELPDPQQLPPISQLAQYPSIELFVERARVSQPDFDITDQNAESVVSICVKLDGLPLAIELAAGHVSLLSTHEIADRLGNRLQLLKTKTRDLPSRQRTLRGAIDWSYNLLESDEQALFRKLGVFVPGWTIEAATAVARSQDSPNIDIVESLGTLIDKSLITRMGAANKQAQQRASEQDGRLGMLETLREYALNELATHGEEIDARDRHARYYLSFVEETDDVILRGSHHSSWVNMVEGQYGNAREALSWLLETKREHDESELDRIELGAQFCTALFVFWDKQNFVGEAYTWYLKAAERIAAFVAEKSNGELSVAAARQISPNLPALWARMLTGAGVMSYYRRDYMEARDLNERALVIRREIGDRSGTGACLNNLGNIASDQGDYEAGQHYLLESLEIARELDIPWKILAALNNLGVVEINLAHFNEARAYLSEAYALGLKEEGRQSMAEALNNLSIVARFQGDYAEARRCAMQVLEIDRELGHKAGIILCLHNMGLNSRDEGNFVEAKAHLLEGMPMAAEQKDRKIILEYLEAFAGLALETGDAERAIKLYGAARSIRDVINIPVPRSDLPYYERSIEATRAQLAPDKWSAAWNRGQAMTIEEASGYAQQV